MDTRYYDIGGFTVQVNSDLLFKPDTFQGRLKQFEAPGPGKDNIMIHHHFSKEVAPQGRMAERIYYKKPWAIFRHQDELIYEWIQGDAPHTTCHRKVIANKEHTRIDTYNDAELTNRFLRGQLTEISLLPTDQLFLSRALAYRQGCIIHSMGLIHKNNGYLFVGHSEAGKSTLAKIMKNDATILCDDRNIIRKTKEDYTLYGTWRHSDFPDISSLSAPLKGIFFLHQSDTNQIDAIDDQKTRFKKLLSCLVKPFASDGWWELSIDFLDTLSKSIACWDLKFDKSGKIKEHIANLK